MLRFSLRICIVVFAAAYSQQSFAHECGEEYASESDPTEIRAPVKDQYANFEWMTDVDVVNGQSWLCNCIFNRDDKGWSGQWIKGGIAVAVGKPLASGKGTCRAVLLGTHSNDPDRNAPIIYATSNQTQVAAVYVAAFPRGRAIELALQIRSSQLDEANNPRDIFVNVEFRRKEPNTVEAFVTASEGLVVGLSGFSSGYSEVQQSDLLSYMKGDAAFVGYENLPNWINDASALPDLLKMTNLEKPFCY